VDPQSVEVDRTGVSVSSRSRGDKARRFLHDKRGLTEMPPPGPPPPWLSRGGAFLRDY
jgi:hypothetical protein